MASFLAVPPPSATLYSAIMFLMHHSQAVVVYTDFKKAFDIVNHGVLVKVLKKQVLANHS